MQNTSGALTTQDLADLRARLEQHRATTARQIAERRKTLTSATAARPDESDWASESVDQGLIARLMDRDTKLLREIDHALAKLDVGTYGVCEATGDAIDLDRLRVRPWSRLSLGAKEGREREEAGQVRDADVVIDREERKAG